VFAPLCSGAPWIYILHTPASIDYQQPEISYMDILTTGGNRGVWTSSRFTDHNTVAGYRKMQEEVQQLQLCWRRLNRLLPDEQMRLSGVPPSAG
jgi:hypothetical protein